MSAALALSQPAPRRYTRPDSRDQAILAAFESAMAPHAVEERDAQIIDFPVPASATAPTLATYRRRRMAVVAAAVAAVLLTAAVLGVGGAGATAPPASPSNTVTVAPGQSLWDVAESVAPAGADTRTVMLELAEFNGVTPGSVPAWTVLVVPSSLG